MSYEIFWSASEDKMTSAYITVSEAKNDQNIKRLKSKGKI